MQYTKHDLSFDKITVDYEGLIKTAGIACYHAKMSMEHYMRQTYLDFSIKDVNKGIRDNMYAAHYLAKATRDYAEALETYSTLLDGRQRSEKILQYEEKKH